MINCLSTVPLMWVTPEQVRIRLNMTEPAILKEWLKKAKPMTLLIKPKSREKAVSGIISEHLNHCGITEKQTKHWQIQSLILQEPSIRIKIHLLHRGFFPSAFPRRHQKLISPTVQKFIQVIT